MMPKKQRFGDKTATNIGLQLAGSMEVNWAIGILLNIIFVSATYGYVRPAVGRVR